MKLLNRIIPKKERFISSALMIIITFAWADITDTIMLALDQGSLVFIKLGKYLQDASYNGNVVINTNHIFSFVTYLQMADMWLGLA